MFTRSLFATPDLAQQGQILARVAELVDQGRIRSTLADDLGPINAENLTAAHRTLLQQRCIGKLVLSGFGTAHP
jgi:NADPH:quinone reductase-like Zn-dependent oxidoreductase